MKGRQDMELKTSSVTGTMESSDIQIMIEPRREGGVELELTSSVQKQYGRQIAAVIRETLAELAVENAYVKAVDKGALDCTIRARVSAAVFRAAGKENRKWEVKS